MATKTETIVSAKIYVGSGLEPGRGGSTRHRSVIDPHEILPTVEKIVSKRFEGSTITKGRGRWQGRGEPSLVIELWRHNSERQQFFADVKATARALVNTLDQASIALVTTDAGKQNVSYLLSPEPATTSASRRRKTQ